MKTAKPRSRSRQDSLANSLLGAHVRAFLTEPVAINVASHDAQLFPSIARGYGCRLGEDRFSITVFLASQRAQAVLHDLRAGAPIAVAFSRPKTHATVQLKGIGAVVSPLEPGDREIMRTYGAAFHAEIVSLGYFDPFASGLVAPVENEALAVTFTPIAAFEQTPGPDAGKPLSTNP